MEKVTNKENSQDKSEKSHSLEESKSRWLTEEGKAFHLEIVNFIKANINKTTINFNESKLPKWFGSIGNRKDLSGINLSGIDFSNSNICNCLFTAANFSKANFSAVKLENLILDDCDFKEAIFYNVELGEKTSLSNADFSLTQVTNLNGLKDTNISIPFKYSTPTYFDILKKLIYKMREKPFADKGYTTFDSTSTEGLSSPRTKELREYVNWYQQLMYQIDTYKDRNRKNKLSLFFGILLTNYWSSYTVLASWALAGNATIATLITFCPYLTFNYPASVASNWTWTTNFYYCLVTFTTLGYGDVTPQNGLSQIAAGIVAVSGYVILGVLVYLILRKADRKY